MKSGKLSIVITVTVCVASVNCAPNLQSGTREGRELCSLSGDCADACVAACAKACPYTGPGFGGTWACEDNRLFGKCICAESCQRPLSTKAVIAAVEIWIPAAEKLCAENCGTKSNGVDSDSCTFIGRVIACNCKPKEHHHGSH